MMPAFRVGWTIDIDADTPAEAAKTALEIQRAVDSIATVFEVVPQCISCKGYHADTDSMTIDLQTGTQTNAFSGSTRCH